MESKTIGIIISVAIALLMGVILVQIIADNLVTKTRLLTITETINFKEARLANNEINETYYFHVTGGCPMGDWRASYSDCDEIDWLSVKNSSGETMTDPTDVIKISNGAVCTGVDSGDLSFVNSSAMWYYPDNTSTVTYSYCGDEYITSSWQRTIMNMIPGFFALAVLITGAFVIFWILRNEGIDIS